MSARLLLLALLVGLVFAQVAPTCETWASPVVQAMVRQFPMCAVYNSTSLVYSNNGTAGLPPWSGAAFAAMRLAGFRDTNTGGGLPRTCLDKITRFFCGQFFRPCYTNNGGAVFGNPCQATCTDLASDPLCIGTLKGILGAPSAVNLSQALIDIVVPSCNATYPPGSPVTGQSLFGDLSYGGSPPFVASCSNQAPAPQVMGVTWACVEPITTSKSGTDAYCELICPPLFINNIGTLAIVSIVLNWVALPMIIVVLLLRLSIPKLNRFPAVLVQLMLFGYLWIVLSAVIMTCKGWRNTICVDGSMPLSTQNNGSCASSAFFFHLGVMWYMLSWMMLAVHGALTVLLQHPLNSVPAMWATYGIVIGVSIILSIVPAAASVYGGVPVTPWCSLTVDNWQYGAFFGPMGFILLVGAICIAFLVIKMAMTSGSSSFALKANVRLILFLIITSSFIAFFFSFRFYAFTGFDNWSANFNNWVGCALFTADPSGSCPRGDHLNDNVTSALTVLVMMQGIIISLFFGSTPELWTNWSDRVMPWQGIQMMGTDATSTTAASSGSSSSQGGDDSWMTDMQS